MNPYAIRFLDAAQRDLARLDKPIARRILARLEWLTVNFEALTPKPLTGNLSGLYKLRVGDYRVIYEPLYAEHSLMVHLIDHHRQVYRKR